MPTRDDNKRMWNAGHDWSALGEEWTPHEAWKRNVLRWTIDRYLKPGAIVVEIGPGGGRWTVELLKHSPRKITLVDLAEKCIELCRNRFAGFQNIEYRVNDGMSIPGVDDRSVDFVWSFDCLVHVEREEIVSYMKEIRRILAPDGIAILHYTSLDRQLPEDAGKGWRSNFTFREMFEIVETLQFKPLEDLYDPTLAHSNTSVVIFGHGPECALAPPPV